MNTFLISDSHFGHNNIITFKKDDGTLIRPFESVEEMDEHMVHQWNSTVRPKDKVYHLGDVVINRKALKTLERLNGDKVLIRGNHDIFPLRDYWQYFRDIRGVHVHDKHILSHIPLHKESVGRWVANIHGHLHERRVMAMGMHGEIIDPKYFSVCVEQIDYTPMSWEDVKAAIQEQQR